MSEPKVRKRRWIAATAVTACVLAGGLLYLKSAADNKAWAQGRYVHPSGLIEPSQEQSEVDQVLLRKAIARAKTLRTKVRPWALRNKALLQRMLSAQPEDEGAMLAVYKAVPFDVRQVGLTHKDDLGGGDPPFSWGTTDKMLAPAQLAERMARDPLLRRTIEFGRQMRSQNFRDHRDLDISSSVMSGQYSVQLWASGRITYTRPSRQLPKPGRVGIPVEAAQVAPPHDFLQDSVQPQEDAVPSKPGK